MLLPQPIGVLNGKYDDFVTDWYSSAGVYVTTLMLVNSVVPLVAPILTWSITAFKRYTVLKKKVCVYW